MAISGSRRRLCVLGLMCALALEADPAGAEPVDGASVPVRWYGWHMLGSDAAGIGMLVAGDEAKSDHPKTGELLLAGGASTMARGGPMEHLRRDNWYRAGASLAMRIALPIAAGYIAGRDEDGDCHACAGDTFDGFLVGSLLAIGLDAALLSWDREPAPRSGDLDRPGWMQLGVTVTGSGSLLIGAGGMF